MHRRLLILQVFWLVYFIIGFIQEVIWLLSHTFPLVAAQKHLRCFTNFSFVLCDERDLFIAAGKESMTFSSFHALQVLLVGGILSFDYGLDRVVQDVYIFERISDLIFLAQ